MGETCSTYGEARNAYSIFVRKPVGKRSLGRLRHGYDNIKANPKGLGC
jgi:hypothetical protein